MVVGTRIVAGEIVRISQSETPLEGRNNRIDGTLEVRCERRVKDDTKDSGLEQMEELSDL